MSAPLLCKFDCGKKLTWDTKTNSFKAQDGTPNTKERCESLKKPVAPANGKSETAKMHEENMVANRLLVAASN